MSLTNGIVTRRWLEMGGRVRMEWKHSGLSKFMCSFPWSTSSLWWIVLIGLGGVCLGVEVDGERNA